MKKRVITTIISMIMAVNTCIGASIIMPIKAYAANSWNFGYTGGVQEFTAPSSGKYYIEMYGASGGGAYTISSSNTQGGFGGYTHGYINLLAGQKIYISVGQVGSINGSRTFGGGGAGGSGSGSGGGATHIAYKTGALSSLSSETDRKQVIAVAGGGGGKYAVTGWHNAIGSGGGTYGGGTVSATAPSQSYGYTFGQGQDHVAGGAGGGGWYGGCSATETMHGGAGGSSYIGGLYDAETSFSRHTGNGTVSIKYIGAVKTTLELQLGNHISYNGKHGNVVIEGNMGDKATINIVADSGYTFEKWEVISGSFNLSGNTYTFGTDNCKVKALYKAPLTLKGDTTELKNKSLIKLQWEQDDPYDKTINLYQSTDNSNWNIIASSDDSYKSQYSKYWDTPGQYTYDIKISGIYTIRLDGAQGSNGASGTGGKGATTTAKVKLNAGTKLYVVVGGQNGYNGGGAGYSNSYGSSGSGGGATHIATSSGLLSSFGNTSNASKCVIAVAAGGGGGGGQGSRGWSAVGTGNGGSGGRLGSNGIGGNNSGDDISDLLAGRAGTGATLTSGGSGGATGSHHSNGGDHTYHRGCGGGGGGGWFGGGGGGSGWFDFEDGSGQGYTGGSGYFGQGGNGGNGSPMSGWGWHTGAGGGGGGGSSWTNTNCTDITFSSGSHSGNGYASITLDASSVVIGDNTIGSYAIDTLSPYTPSKCEITDGNGAMRITWNQVSDRGLQYYYKAKSYIGGKESKTSNTIEVKALSGLKGYYYYLDNASTGTVNTGHKFTIDEYVDLTTNDILNYRYIHIAAIDYAGNISGTYTYNIPLGVSISFDKNDTAKNINGDTCTSNATGSTSSQIVLYGKTENLNANGFSKVGYTFSNWNTKSNNSGTSFTNKQSVAYNWLVANLGYTVKLYAIWKPIEYDIVYNKNKPSKASSEVQGEMSSHHIYDKPQNLAKNTYTLTGWRFNGWNTRADGKGTAYADAASVKNLTTTNGGKVTLYAQWVQNTYTVNIYQNKPSNASHDIARLVTPSGYTWSTDHWTKTFTYDDTTIGYTPTQIFSLKGWTIDKVNYYSKADGTGTKYTSSSRNLTATHNGTVNIYVKWTANKYNIYYEKGLTSDTSTTTIANANVNANIQKTGTDRPYTIATYDSPVKFATIASLKGRKYTLTFDSNKPSSISKQKSNTTAVPTSISTITGNLTSKNIWQIGEQDSDVKTNLTPTMGSEVSKPNYKDADGKYATATALWNNTKLNNFGSPTLDGWKFVGWYTKKTGENSEAVSNTTDMIRVVNSSKNVSPNSKVDTRYNVTEFTVQPKTTEFNQTLYARWQRTITLTFNMNGGQYKGDSSNVVITGIYYTNADGYNFSLSDTPTAASLPNYEKQINQIDAYGVYDANGENSKYTKYDETTGVTYRFLGWSTNKNATEPDSKYIVYSSSKAQTLRLYDDTTLYAVWEPVLIASISVQRTLGDLTFSDGTKPINSVKSKRDSDDFNYLDIIIKPGEQASYTIQSYGKSDRTAVIGFDPKIEDIYSHVGLWTDNLNPNTGTGEELREYCGLSRQINSVGSQITRKFYIPQYLGTEQSYISSIGVKQYLMEIGIGQESYYYKYVYGYDEVVAAFVTIYITDDKAPIIDPINPTPTDPTPKDPVEPSEPVISVLDELRSKLKIRLH